MTSEPQTRIDPFAPDSQQEPHDIELGLADVVLAILTLPLLFWALMYAVTGHESLYATRAGRMRVYRLLLVIEAVLLVVGVVLWTVL